MDPKESRRYITSNKAAIIDREAERRPSLLGRLFRRSSSTTDETAVQGMSNLGNMGQSFDESAGSAGTARSITSAVQSQFLNKEPARPLNTPEFSIFT